MDAGEGTATDVAQSDEGEEEKSQTRHCPKCNREWTKTAPTLAQVRTAIDKVIKSHKSDIKALADDASFGYAGSVARGTVGNEKKLHYGMEPDIRGECGLGYDVDGFVITDAAKDVKKIMGKRWASRSPAWRQLEGKMRPSFAKEPDLAYMKGGKAGFSIVLYMQAEANKPINKGGRLVTL